MASPPIGIGMIQQWLRRMEPEYLLRHLKESGVDFVEIYLAKEKWEDREKWLRIAKEAGLFFTFHGPYDNRYDITLFEDSADNEVKKAFIEVMELASKLLSEFGYRSRVNLHGASDLTTGNRAFLHRITVDFVRWLAREREVRKWPLDFVVELLPHNSEKLKAGDTTEELVKLGEELGDEISGFCWDFGHYRSNEYQCYDSLLAAEFLTKVRHVHIHDFRSIVDDIDHCPLKYGEVPYRKYLSMLDEKDLFMVLELNYRNSESCGDPAEGLTSSIRELKNARADIFTGDTEKISPERQ